MSSETSVNKTIESDLTMDKENVDITDGLDKSGPSNLANLNRIAKMPESTYEMISSAQIITNIDQAVRELMDNAIDADATCIDIRLQGKGLTKIEVSDNGKGISKHDFELLGIAHATSKISDVNELQKIETYGFRGQALHNFASFSNLQIITKAKEDDVGSNLTFDSNGKLAKIVRKAREIGTTVLITNLFERMPVRRKDLQSKLDDQINAVIYSVEAYAISHPKIKFILHSDRGRLFMSRGGDTTNVHHVLELIFSRINLKEFQGVFPSKEVMKMYDIEGYSAQKLKGYYKIHGYIVFLESNMKVKSNEQEFIYVNKRHVKVNMISKIIKNLTKETKIKKTPMIILFIEAIPDLINVTYSATKREVGLQHDRILHAIFHETLLTLINNDKGTFVSNTPRPTVTPVMFRKRTINSLNESLESLRTPSNKRINVNNQFITTPNMINTNKRIGNRASRSSMIMSRNNDDSILFPALANMPSINGTNYVSENNQSANKQSSLLNYVQPMHPQQVIYSQSGPPVVINPVVSSSSNNPANINIEIHTPSTNKPSNERLPVMKHSPQEINENFNNYRNIFAENQTENDISLNNILIQNNSDYLRESNDSNQEQGDNLYDFDDTFDMICEMDENNLLMDESPKRMLSDTNITKNKRFDFFDDFDDLTDEGNDVIEDNELFEFNTGIPQNFINDEIVDLNTIDKNDISGLLENGPFKTDCRLLHHQDVISELVEQPNENDPCYSSPKIILDPTFLPCIDFNIVSSVQTNNSFVKYEFDDELLNKYGVHVDVLFNSKYSTYVDPEIGSITNMLEEMNLTNLIDDYMRNNDDVLNEEENDLDKEVVLTKDEFLKIKPHWQFNRGFILCTYNNNLFIVDQHAADEKFNYEYLLKTTKMEIQPLVNPVVLSTTSLQLNTILLFQQELANAGFLITTENRNVVQLLTIPSYFGKCLEISEIYEILEKIQQLPTNRGYLTKNLNYIFATKACHKAIRFGDPLKMNQMRNIVIHLRELKDPWECPHGRPTIRLFKKGLPNSIHNLKDNQQ